MHRLVDPAPSVLAAFVLALVWSQVSGVAGGDGFELEPELRIEGPASHVRDGDTIEVGGVAVRIANLDCAGTGTEAGRVAAERMTRLVQGETVACELEGRRSYDREVGTCALGSTGEDVGEVMIAEGVCSRW